MPDSIRFLHPETFQRNRHHNNRTHNNIEGVLAGGHRSPYFGQSVEFLQHREYARGDDMRRIDWAAYARTGEPVLKLFRAEEDVVARLLARCSPPAPERARISSRRRSTSSSRTKSGPRRGAEAVDMGAEEG